MKSDSIDVIQGSLGSGKSIVAVMECILHLKSGGVVATNFDFTPLWAWMLAGTQASVWLKKTNRYDLAMDFWRRAYKVGSPKSMIDLSGDRGENLARLCSGRMRSKIDSDPRGYKVEGKGLLVLDDCHHFFNSREFQKNKDYVAFFSNARKYGWRTILITHDIEALDKQIRPRVETETFFRNLRKVNLPCTPIPLCPWDCFVMVRKYSGKGPGSGLVHSKDFFFRDPSASDMYDTLQLFNPDDVLDDVTRQGLCPSEYVYDARKGAVDRRQTRLIGQASVWPNCHETALSKTPRMGLESFFGHAYSYARTIS